MANLSEEELQDLIFDTLECKPPTLNRSKTSDSIQRSPKPRFARSRTMEGDALKKKVPSRHASPKRSSPKRTTSSSSKRDQLDPATIIQRLESLAASDDNQADEFMQKLKGDIKEKVKGDRARSPKRTTSSSEGRRSRSGSRDPKHMLKQLEKYGVDAADGEEYLEYLKEATGTTSPKKASLSPVRRSRATSPKPTPLGIAA